MKKILLFIFLLAYNSIFCQSNETCYTYSGVRTRPNNHNYNIYKHIAYISPIYSGKCGGRELTEITSQFRKIHFKLVHKFISEQPKVTSYSLYATNGDVEFSSTSKYATEFQRNHTIAKYKDLGYKVILVDDKTNTSSEITKTKTFFQNVKIDDQLYVDGYVIVKSKFEFFGYPYIVSEYQNLIITNVKIKDKMGFSQERFDAKNDVLGLNRVDFLPYKPSNKPLIDANFWVWTPKVLNPNSYRKEHYKIFNYPVKGIATITDNFGNKEVDSYFKNYNHKQKSDDYFWTNSILKNPKRSPMTYTLSAIEINKISKTLAKELKDLIKKYKYNKEYDFWGNKKKQTNKKKKNDDFWKN